MPKSKTLAGTTLTEQTASSSSAHTSTHKHPSGRSNTAVGEKYSLQDPGQGYVFIYTVLKSICQEQINLCQNVGQAFSLTWDRHRAVPIARTNHQRRAKIL